MCTLHPPPPIVRLLHPSPPGPVRAVRGRACLVGGWGTCVQPGHPPLSSCYTRSPESVAGGLGIGAPNERVG